MMKTNETSKVRYKTGLCSTCYKFGDKCSCGYNIIKSPQEKFQEIYNEAGNGDYVTLADFKEYLIHIRYKTPYWLDKLTNECGFPTFSSTKNAMAFIIKKSIHKKVYQQFDEGLFKAYLEKFVVSDMIEMLGVLKETIEEKSGNPIEIIIKVP